MQWRRPALARALGAARGAAYCATDCVHGVSGDWEHGDAESADSSSAGCSRGRRRRRRHGWRAHARAAGQWRVGRRRRSEPRSNSTERVGGDKLHAVVQCVMEGMRCTQPFKGRCGNMRPRGAAWRLVPASTGCRRPWPDACQRQLERCSRRDVAARCCARQGRPSGQLCHGNRRRPRLAWRCAMADGRLVQRLCELWAATNRRHTRSLLQYHALLRRLYSWWHPRS